MKVRFSPTSALVLTMTLLSLSMSPVHSQSNNDDNQPRLPSVMYCDNQDQNRNDTNGDVPQGSPSQQADDCTQQRAWIFPQIRFTMTCRYDFRHAMPETSPYFWPNASSPTIQATWGSFLDYVIHDLVPPLGGNAQAFGQVGLFWMHGREGRPGWEIPPCDTNRTQGVVHFWHLTVALNETTTDPDVYATGMTYAQAMMYINKDTIRAGIEAFVCNDLEQFDIAINDGKNNYSNHPDYYPVPEDICPRVTADDTIWQDWWWFFLLVLPAGIALVVMAFVCMGKRRQVSGAADKESNTKTDPVEPSTKV